MINYLALLGWNDGTENEIFTREELIDAFDLDRVVKSPSVFDVEKLRWINSQHLKRKTVSQLLPLIDEQLDLEGFWSDSSGEGSKERTDFTVAATALAKQMLETTKDVAHNTKKVLGYNLPESYDAISDNEAKHMIEQGYFYLLASHVLDQFDRDAFILPTENPLDTFCDPHGNVALEESNDCAYARAYKKHMKTLAKEAGGIKGKNLFHPIRLMLTGEMSGQDVAKQLSLLSLASQDRNVLNKENIGLVEFGTRMDRLRSFLATIPAEFHSPSVVAEAKQHHVEEEAAAAEVTSESPMANVFDDLKNSYEGPPISALDIRVGRITKVWEHPEADKLYCEEIDVGEDEPRMIASGLRPYLDTCDMEDRKVLVLCNLKARKMVGFPSHGMVLCASNSDHSIVRLVSPPIDAKIGERITVPDMESTEEPFTENKVGKKKIFEKIAPHLLTNEYGIPTFLGRPLMTSAGACTSAIPDGTVS